MSNVLVSLISFSVVFSALLVHPSVADVGTAAQYGPPFIPTECFGGDASQFPTSNLFGAAGEGIWDNGAACGRKYEVRCLSGVAPRTCIPDQSVQIRIVDRAQSSRSRPSADATTIVLSTTAFRAIANASASLINVEFQQSVFCYLLPRPSFLFNFYLFSNIQTIEIRDAEIWRYILNFELQDLMDEAH